MIDSDFWLSRFEASQFLTGRGYAISLHTLANLASLRQGPPYKRFGGRSLYTIPDLLAWAEARSQPGYVTAPQYEAA